MADDEKAEEQSTTADTPNESVAEEAPASETSETAAENNSENTDSKPELEPEAESKPEVEEEDPAPDNPIETTKDGDTNNETINVNLGNDDEAEAEEGIKLTIEEEHSDAELLVDEESMDMEVTSEINNSSDNEKDNIDEDVAEASKSNDVDEKKNKQKRSRKRSRSRSRNRSRSPSDRDRDSQQRLQDKHDTSSNAPYMIRSRIFVGHLDTDNVTKKEVKQLFSPYGKVIGVALHQGYGFVQYDNADSAKAAIKEAHGTPVAGMKIGKILGLVITTMYIDEVCW